MRITSVRIPHHGEGLPPSKDLSWRHAALGLALGALLAAGALALVEAAPDDAPAPEGPAAPTTDAAHDMDEDARCAHMPEHCPPAGGASA